MDPIETQLRRIACSNVIEFAAKIYAAEIDKNVDYSAFLVIGADKILTVNEIDQATRKETIQWNKWLWLKQASSASELTLKGCIAWYMQKLQAGEPDEFTVTIEEVFAVLDGTSSSY